MTYRLLVTGSRQGHQYVFRFLDEIVDRVGAPSLLIVGGDEDKDNRGEIKRSQRGVDLWAKRWAEARGIPYEIEYALWWTHPRAAGPLRNGRMVAKVEPGDHCAAFPRRSRKGTRDCYEQAIDAGLRVHVCAMPDEELTR